MMAGSGLETDPEVESLNSGLSTSRKRASTVLMETHSLQDIEEEVDTSMKRTRKGSNLTDTESQNSEKAARDMSIKMNPRDQLEAQRRRLRYENQDDTQIFIADYMDACMALLSYDVKLELHNLRRCHQLDMTRHTNNLKTSMRHPTLPPGENLVLVEEKLGMKLPVETLEDFERWEQSINPGNAENLEEVTKRRTFLLKYMANETSSSTDFVKDTKTILPLFFKKPVQILYSGIGRVINGVGKKNFSKTMSYECMRDFLKTKYKKSEKEMAVITTTSTWVAAASDRDGGAVERRRARNST